MKNKRKLGEIKNIIVELKQLLGRIGDEWVTSPRKYYKMMRRKRPVQGGGDNESISSAGPESKQEPFWKERKGKTMEEIIQEVIQEKFPRAKGNSIPD